MKNTLAIYPGSFLPLHIGHLDIIKQAIKVFDHVLVAQGSNPRKMDKIDPKYPIRYPLPVKFLENELGIMTGSYDTLLIDFIKKQEEQYNVTIVRGLRNGSDLEYEQNIVAFLRSMYPNIKIVAFYCDPKFRHISSSALRDIEKFSKEEFKKYAVSDY